MRSLILPMLLAAGIVFPAAAQWPGPIDRALSREYKACMDGGDAGRGVTGAMRACTGTELDQQDARLNQAYRITMQRLSGPRQSKLRAAQRGWIKWRAATCRRAADQFREGTMAPVEYDQCTLRETIARRLWLEKYR